MEITKQTGQRVLLYSGLALIIPLLAFPEQFGTQLSRISFVNILYELVYYSLVVWVLHRRTTLIKMVQAAAVCLVYRLALGALLGITITLLYGMDFGVAMSLSLSSYLPAILFQIAVAPWILMQVIDTLYPSRTERDRKPEAEPRTEAKPSSPARTSSSTSASVPPQTAAQAPAPKPKPLRDFDRPVKPEAPGPRRTPTAGQNQQPTGFDRAVNYIGEHGSVNLAAVIDDEGLLLASFTRGDIVAEDWAPLALVALEESDRVLGRIRMADIEKMDFHLRQHRVIVARETGFCLMVMTERHDDDLVNIRINQAVEMINKYVTERYGDKMNTNAERIHVRSAQ